MGGFIRSRSHFFRIIAPSITLNLLLALAASAQQSSATAPSTQPVTVSFPLYGLETSPPSGWQQLPPDRLDVVARWMSPDSQPNSVQGIIMVEMSKPDVADSAPIAHALARQLGGLVDDKPDTLDGETAWRILADPKSDLQLVEALVAIHEGRLYIIKGGVTAGHTCHDQIEFIRQNWKWIPLDPPTSHLDFRDKPGNINAHVSMNYPAAMYIFDNHNTNQRLAIAMRNFQLGRDDFTATVEFGVMPAGATLENIEDGLSNRLRAKLNLPEAFVWHDIENPAAPAAVTQVVPGPATGRQNWIMWGIAGLPANHMALINFSFFDENPANRELYAKTAEKIVASVGPAIQTNQP
jgi:hypothetical protein